MIERPRAVTTLRSILEREGHIPFRRIDRDIALRRRPPMRVDIIDFIRIEPAIFETALDTLGGAHPLRRR